MNTGRPTLLQHKINELKARQAEIAREIDKVSESLNAELRDIASQLGILETTQAILDGEWRKMGVEEVRKDIASEPAVHTISREQSGPNGDVDWSRFDARSIRGIPKIEALVKMAEWAGGTLRMKEIGATLIAGGHSNDNNPTLASSSAYGCLMSTRRFRKTGRGEYTLVK